MFRIGEKDYELCLMDTCAVSEMLKRKAPYCSNLLQSVYERGRGILCFTVQTIAELKQAPHLYTEFCKAFDVIPSLLLKNFHAILAEEVKAYEEGIAVDPVVLPMSSGPRDGYGVQQICESPSVMALEKALISQKSSMLDRMLSLRANYPPKSKSYTVNEINEFARIVTQQQLCYMQRDFIARQLAANSPPDPERFPSLMIPAYMTFYKHYISTRKPQVSDVADILNSAPYPYVDVVITERGQAESMRQIQSRHHFCQNLRVLRLSDVANEKTGA